MKPVLCCAKVWDCCYQILRIMIQIRCCCGLQHGIRNIPIFTWISAMPWELMCLNNSQTELFPLQQLMTSQTNALIARTLLQTSFFLMIIIQADSWQEKWSIPSCRALIWHSTCCLWTHALHCSLNSVAFQAESAQPGDHPLWDQNTVREGIWGARLSGLWGVIPQINMEIMCKACVPIMLSHFFGKISGNLCGSVHNG